MFSVTYHKEVVTPRHTGGFNANFAAFERLSLISTTGEDANIDLTERRV